MATTITAGNATNGAAISSDGTGTLDIKTGTGAGTTAISVNASQAVTMPGNLVVAGTITTGGVPVGGNYALNAYTTSGNFPAAPGRGVGLKLIKVTVVGGGGAGGNGNPSSGGSGGGAGGAAIRVYPAPSLPASAVPYTVAAAAGTSSFGVAPLTVISATGGSGGAAQNPGGAGGLGSNGDINLQGGAGAQANTSNQNPGSTGGNSIFGGGGQGAPGGAATTWGAGGGGGQAVGQANPTGRSGAPGVVIIEEFY